MKKKTKILIFISVLLIFAGGFSSCNGKEPPVEPFLNIETTSITATAEGGIFTIPVSSNGEWTAVVQDVEDNPWLTLTDASGTNEGVITVNIAETPYFTTRSTAVKIVMGNLSELVIVEQGMLEPFLNIETTNITAAAEGGTFTIVVSSNGEWTAVVQDAKNYSWITLADTWGTNDGEITVNIEENLLFETRSATIKISMGSLNETVAVEQDAAEEPPIEPFLEIEITSITAPAEGGAFSISVNSNGEWTAVVQDSWLALTNYLGVNDGVITVNVAENTFFETRSATIKISMGSLNEYVVISQEAAEEFKVSGDIIWRFDHRNNTRCIRENIGSSPILTVINNKEELKAHTASIFNQNCPSSCICRWENWPNIDFSIHTVLVAYAQYGGGTRKGAVDFQHNVLSIDVCRFLSLSITHWYVAIVVDKITDENNVELRINYISGFCFW